MIRALVLTCALAGCTAAVDVDGYTFEPDPCGPRPPSCTGGRTLAFVIRSIYVPAESTPHHRDGVDLDGTPDPICDQPDFVAPDGTLGVDNAMAPVFETLLELTGRDVRAEFEAAAAAGTTQVVVLDHVDDLVNDDCIEVTRRTTVLPDGVTVADLDRDHDGLLDGAVTLDYLTPTHRDPVACVVDGTLHAHFPPTVEILALSGIEGTVGRGRLRMPLALAGSEGAIVAGSVPIADLVDRTPGAIVEYIRQHADLDPSSRSARDCSAISFAYNADLVPCVLGRLRSPTP